MQRRPLKCTRTYTLFPYATLFRSVSVHFDQLCLLVGAADLDQQRDLAVAVVILGEIGEFLGPDDPETGHAVRGHFVGFGQRHRQVAHPAERSEEHTPKLQSLMRISYAVFCSKKKQNTTSTSH